MEKGLPLVAEVLRRARRHGVKVVLGTDGVAGAHGRNAEEFVYRVKDGGDRPMDAIVSGTSVARSRWGWARGSARSRRGGCGPGGGRRRSAGRHHGRPPRGVRDEARARVPLRAGKLMTALAPTFSIEEAQRLAAELFGIEAEASPLPSERDQNFRLRTAAGGSSFSRSRIRRRVSRFCICRTG